MSTLGNARRIALSTLSRVCLKSASVSFQGMPLRVPLIHGLGAGHLSPKHDWMQDMMPRLLKGRPGAFLDIGASVGLYLVRLRSFDRERAYYGFEPNPACSMYVQELIRQNAFENSRVFTVALSDRRELRTFYARRFGDRMGSLQASWRRETERPFTFDLMTYTGDELIEPIGLDAIAMCKVDVEASELEVLRGLKRTLARYRPLVQCEIYKLPATDHPAYPERHRRHEALLELIPELDYRIFKIAEDLSLAPLDSVREIEEQLHRDYFLVHEQDRDAFVARWNEIRP